MPAARPARGVMNSERQNLEARTFVKFPTWSPPKTNAVGNESKLTPRTSDNPHRPRLASSPSPLPRGTFGYRQNNKQLSLQGLTQTPLAPAGEETRTDLASTRALPRASAEGAKRTARSWEALVPTSRIRATCAVGSGKEHRREAIQIRGAAATATRARTAPAPSATTAPRNSIEACFDRNPYKHKSAVSG